MPSTKPPDCATPSRVLPHIRAALIAVCLCLAMPAAAAPQATAYVPTLDPAYRDLDALVVAGLVRGLILGQRPYSRAAFARAAESARARLDEERLETEGRPIEARFTEALERLEARFPGEPEARVTPRSLSAEASWADNPMRAIESRYNGNPNLIDADLAPLLQRNQGRVLADGMTVAAEALADFRVGSRLAGQLQPRAWVSHSLDAALVRGYVRALLGNLSVDVGRDLVAHGHARELGPVLSHNARGLDMIRLSMERPARFPWIFRYIGPVAFTGLVGDMGRDQDTPGSKLFVIEGAVRPHPNFEMGIALMNHQLGEGAPDATWGQRVRDILFLVNRRPLRLFPPVGRGFSDKMLGLDARLTIPSRGLELYAEMATTDDHNMFAAPREALWNDAAWTVGLRLVGLGAEGRTDAWAEVGRNGIRPYTHHQFTSGLAVDRRVLGSPLGPLGTGFEGGLDWTGLRDHWSVAAAWERYQGDTYYDPQDDEGLRFVRIADNPDEIRLRTTLDWIRETARPGLRTTVRLGYEHVTRFDFTDRNRSNFLAQVSVGYVW